jgi:hypothetical protein
VVIRHQLSAAPPAGVTITFPLGPIAATGAGATAVFTRCDNTGAVAVAALTINSASTDLNVYYRLTTDSTPIAQETLTVVPAIAFVGVAGNLPLPAVTISYQSTMALGGTAFTAGGAVIATPVPRYCVAWLAGGTILTINPSRTILIVPFATTVSAAGYDTGISISNTTKDPGAGPLALAAAVPQLGGATFYLYPQLAVGGAAVPAPIVYPTAAGSPGVGLDANGLIPAGSTYSVLLSNILADAGAPADFTGYAIIITGFTNAHGQYVISDFAGFSQGAQALVVAAGRAGAVPEALGN